MDKLQWNRYAIFEDQWTAWCEEIEFRIRERKIGKRKGFQVIIFEGNRPTTINNPLNTLVEAKEYCQEWLEVRLCREEEWNEDDEKYWDDYFKRLFDGDEG